MVSIGYLRHIDLFEAGEQAAIRATVMPAAERRFSWPRAPGSSVMPRWRRATIAKGGLFRHELHPVFSQRRQDG